MLLVFSKQKILSTFYLSHHPSIKLCYTTLEQNSTNQIKGLTDQRSEVLSGQNNHTSTHMHTNMLVTTDSTQSLPKQHYPRQPHGTLQHTLPKTLQRCLKHRPSVERLALCTWARNAALRDNKISIYVGTIFSHFHLEKIQILNKKLLPTPNVLPVLYNERPFYCSILFCSNKKSQLYKILFTLSLSYFSPNIYFIFFKFKTTDLFPLRN